jgi:CheY-like chemotaxis protein
MSGLQDFLTPFSHLVFANRDKVIVLLAGVLALVTIQLLVSRWRAERLRRDLAAAKSGGSSGSRRYVTSAPVVEEAPVESGMLPPVKGGRSYARNLGTALQKAGITPQIYSPPSPPGWATNTNPQQPSMGQPGPPYAPQNVPWAAPAAPQGSPWGGYPAGGGRGMQAPAPNPAPFYQPQQQTPPQPMSQPIAPPAGVPGPFAPPVNSPFGPPAFPAATSGPAAPPSFAPPATPAAPPAPPSFAGPPPAAEPPAADPSGGDASRRGKPKRRRFNFNVLENLEKMVQAKIAEPAPTPAPPTWTPPVAGSPATWTPPVSAATPAPAAPAPPALAGPSLPQPVAAAQPAPAVEATPPAEEAPTEAESLPLSFGPPVAPEAEEQPEAEKESLPLRFGPEVEAETVEAEPAEPEPEPAPEPEPEPVVAEAPEAEPEPQPEPEPEPVREARGSMRSMLFGEEAVAKHEPEPAPEPVASEPEPVAAELPWGASTYTPEPVTEAPESEKVRPWNATPSWEPEPEPETVAAAEPEEAPAVPETPAVDGGSDASAGTIVIIEDDPTAATYYATLFRGNGYRVEVANDGVSGVDLCTRLQPQLIMLDVMMPRQNGILVLQTLRASDETKNTPVVVMSNFSEPTLIKRAVQLGALEYVIKTQVEGPALLTAVPRWMNHEKAFAAAA